MPIGTFVALFVLGAGHLVAPVTDISQSSQIAQMPGLQRFIDEHEVQAIDPEQAEADARTAALSGDWRIIGPIGHMGHIPGLPISAEEAERTFGFAPFQPAAKLSGIGTAEHQLRIVYYASRYNLAINYLKTREELLKIGAQ